MLFEVLCGLVVFKLFRRLFSGGDADGDSFLDADCNRSDALFSVASRLEKIYGGKSYVGLRIPDPDTGSRQHIEIVLVTKKEVIVVAVRSFSGFVEVGKDGSWVCAKDKKRTETLPDPVIEITRQVEILESYLEQRGVPLPKGYLIGRVVLPNPDCRTAPSIDFQTEVISFEKWTELKSEPKTGFSNWIKDAFQGGKGEMQDGLYQRLNLILSTAPMWDRLEVKDKNLLGEFVEFKGNQEDVQELRNLKRSKVGQFIVQKSSLFGVFGRSRVRILYVPRDYRSEGTSSFEWKEVSVKPATEFIFHPLNSKKTRKFKVSSITSLTLSV
ncbi:uncharacterized protein M6B38_101520 [Iris pallida]|uniref:NERD domain-containing protein n=1 Tax=Iris pallida TaxID=29817 RepID=A0AAX6IX09_IRIPA|nr:uncharacterized protein M6B38_101520 [Iris pallida]